MSPVVVTILARFLQTLLCLAPVAAGADVRTGSSPGMSRATFVILATLFGLIILLPGSRTAALFNIVHSLPPLFIAVFLVYFKKSNFDLDTFFREFQHVGHKQKALVSLAVMAAFVVLILDQERVEGSPPDLGPFFIQTLAATIAVGLIDALK